MRKRDHTGVIIPLYDPYPLFLAIQAANHPGQPLACEWDQAGEPIPRAAPPTLKEITGAVMFFGDRNGAAYKNLNLIGLAFSEGSKPAKMLIVDMMSVDSLVLGKLRTGAEEVVGEGGTVLLVGPNDRNAKLANIILPARIVRLPDEASSLLPNTADPRTASLSLKDLYFAEDPTNNTISSYSVGGDFAQGGSTLLYRNNTDWRRWLKGGEYSKTISIYRSELENKQSPVLVEYPVGAGNYIASTIELENISEYHVKMYRELLGNMGLPLNEGELLGFDGFAGYSRRNGNRLRQ